jgi:hypothetical protein
MSFKMLLEASAMCVPLCCGWYILTTFSWYRMVLKATNTSEPSSSNELHCASQCSGELKHPGVLKIPQNKLHLNELGPTTP